MTLKTIGTSFYIIVGETSLSHSPLFSGGEMLIRPSCSPPEPVILEKKGFLHFAKNIIFCHKFPPFFKKSKNSPRITTTTYNMKRCLRLFSTFIF